jgi:hypothetical protein
LRLAVLLHDAPDYVIGDMISPFKAVIGDAYKAVERRLLTAIYLRFGLPAKTTPATRTTDQDGGPRRGLSGGDPSRRLRRCGSAAFLRPRAGSPAIERDYLRPWPAETRFREWVTAPSRHSSRMSTRSPASRLSLRS